jgi:SAM-dependent methyltransferase
MDLHQRFEQDEVWDQGYDDDPEWMGKHRIMEAMMPRDVRSILDVGCGNGAQAELLSQSYSVTGIDGSATALRRVRVPCIRSRAQALPVASRSFDVVWSSQLLEHLPDDALAWTVAEMQRVARSWLLISVPHRENLRFRRCRCHACGELFHIYGHLQSFDQAKLRRLMKPARLHAWSFCGPSAQVYVPVLLWFRQALGRKWFSYPPASPVCPYCGHLEREVWEGNRIARWCDGLNECHLSYRRSLQTRWMVTLWKPPEVD